MERRHFLGWLAALPFLRKLSPVARETPKKIVTIAGDSMFCGLGTATPDYKAWPVVVGVHVDEPQNEPIRQSRRQLYYRVVRE